MLITKGKILAILIMALAAVLASSAFSQSRFWWDSDWSSLVSYLAGQGDKTLKCSFKAGDPPSGTVYITLFIDKRGSIVLKMNGPGENIIDVDESTGKASPRQGRAIYYFRDNNRDGFPEEYRDATDPDESIRSRYISIGESDTDNGVLSLWNIGIGYSINKHLCAVESALPRK